MEKASFVVNGGLKLPIGYRFRPTDEELVVHYLKRKAFGLLLPASVIPEFDVFQADPWSLPGDWKEKRYFFSRKRENYHGRNCNKVAGSDYWKPVGKDRRILDSKTNQVVGLRQKLVFYQAKKRGRSQWIMHEYSLIGFASVPNATQKCEVKLGNWVVYRVFQRKQKPKKNGGAISDKQATKVADHPQPCSSGVTEVSSNDELEQEEISSLVRFSF